MQNLIFNASRIKLKQAVLLFTTAAQILQPVASFANPAPDQLPTGGQVSAGSASISQNGKNMNITQSSDRAAINWDSFDIGSSAHVNFDQPSSSSVALNRVTGGNPSQIFGKLTANGQVFITNGAGVYFAPGSSVNVGALVATTHDISDADFMEGKGEFRRNGSEGSVVNEGSITVDIGKYVALLAPEVRNDGIIIAQMGTVAMAAGESFELKFNGEGALADITVTKSDIDALVENKQAVKAPGGLIILSAQAVNGLQGGVVKNSGTIEAAGMVDDGGVIRLVASDKIELGGDINADAKSGSDGKGGKVLAIASLETRESVMEFSGNISARGDGDGKGGFIETSGSNVNIDENAKVDTQSETGQTGDWLIDPYDYTINGAAATAIVNALNSSNVEVTTSADTSSYGSNGNNSSTGNIVVSNAINSASLNQLTLTAANAITVNAAITSGSLVLNGPGGITLSNNLTTTTNMTLNGNVNLGADVTLTSGISNTYSADTNYVVPTGVTSLTATLVGGVGGTGGTDTSTGGVASYVGSLTASFAVTPGQTIYISRGTGGVQGGNQATNGGGSNGGTNSFGIAGGGRGGDTGTTGNSGGGGGGGAATILALVNNPTTSSAMLVAGGGGGGGGSGNNTACPSQCADQNGGNYQASSMTGQAGYHSGNQGSPINDGGGSGGGGGGLLGGLSNPTVFYINEWTGRGGNVGSSGAANGFTTTSLSTSVVSGTASANGSAIISYGGGAITINGTVNGAHALTISSPNNTASISGAVGGSTALTSLSISGSQGITLSGGGVTTTGAQTYNGPLTLNANNTTFTTTNSAVTFAGNIVKGSGVSSNMVVSAGSGAVNLNGTTGTSSTSIGTIGITTTGITSIAGSVYATSLTKSGTGKTTVSGSLIQTSGGQSYADIFDLGANVSLSSTGTGDITLSKAVSNSNQSNLTINAAGGNVSIIGNLARGTNSIPTPIGDVSVTASGTFTLGSSGTPILAEAKSLSVTAATATIYADTSTFTTIGNTTGTGVHLTNSASFNVSSASTISGPFSGAMTFTKSGAGKLTMSGVNTFTGNMTVSAGVLEIGGSGRLNSGNYSGNVNIGSTGQLRFNTSANNTLGGTFSGAGFANTVGAGTTQITTLSNQNYYNLITAYIVPIGNGGNSSTYGSSTTNLTYQIQTAAGGGSVISDASPTGTAVFSGAPTASSNIGNYTISYASGITLGNERYPNLQIGNSISWTVNAKPLNLAVSKTYDGSASFSSGFSLTGMANSDAAPTVSGSASVSSMNAGSYGSFSSSTLALSNSNYTLTGGTTSVSILARALNIIVSKVYDSSSLFSRGFSLTGMISGDAAPTVSGSANVASAAAATYNAFANNSLSLSNANYTLTGGTVSATITPQPPVVSEVVPPTPVAVIPKAEQNSAALKLPEEGNVSTPPKNETTTLSDKGVEVPADKPAENAKPVQNTVNTGSSSGSTTSGIVVSLVQEPSTQASGVISVMVPKKIVERSDGFTFAVPQQVAVSGGAGSSSLNISLEGGSPLPGWIKFNAENNTFVATNVPAGGLPLRILISVGEKKSTIVISENQ